MEFNKLELLAGFSMLGSVITVLWASIKVLMKRIQDELKDCHNKHDDANKHITELTGQYNYLKGRIEGIEQLSKSVMDRIDRRRKDDADRSVTRIN